MLPGTGAFVAGKRFKNQPATFAICAAVLWLKSAPSPIRRIKAVDVAKSA